MRGSRRTSLLLTAAAALLLVHFFPDLARPVAALALIAALVWIAVIAFRLLGHFREKTARAVQQAADEQEYRSYQVELEALRAQHDPAHEWDTSNYPREYREALNDLHHRHQGMLERRFGRGSG